MSALAEAVSHFKRGELEQAQRLVGEVLAADPRHLDALNLAGVIAGKLGDDARAVTYFERAAALVPDRADIQLNLGIALHESGRLREALTCFERVLVAQPDRTPARMCRAIILTKLGRREEALASYDKILEREPGHFDALHNRGAVLLEMGRAAEALAASRAALGVRADHPEIWTNIGTALRALERYPEALDAYARAARLGSKDPRTHWNEGLCRLLMGDFAQGLPLYEWRWGVPPLSRPVPPPQGKAWTGKEDLAGKTIVLWAEQGLGDTVQFCRYAPMVAARGAQVVLQVQPELAPLLARTPALGKVVPMNEPLPAHDFNCALMSLPLALGTRLETIPGRAPYLAADPARVAHWRVRMEAGAAKLVGVVWAGRATHANDRNRSIPFKMFAPLLEAPARFLSLQKDLREEDRQDLPRPTQLIRLADQLKSVAETAAAIGALDLVITADTLVAHLAGALGKPVWILLPFDPDWRWLLGRSDSPWYPTARLFRQPRPGDWAAVIAEVAARLRAT